MVAPAIVVGPGRVDEARMPLPSGAQQMNAMIAEADGAYARICRAGGVEYISVHADLVQSVAYMSGLAAGDGLHPDAAGHADQAALLGRNPAMRVFLSRDQ